MCIRDRNRELPNTLEGISKKLLLLYIGPYTITKYNNNNTYELTDPISKKIKGKIIKYEVGEKVLLKNR